MQSGLCFELRLDPLQVPAAIGGEEATGVLALLSVAEADAPDTCDPVVPREHLEGLGLGQTDELGRLGAVADVVGVPVGEEVCGRAVDELEALLCHRVPVGRRHAFAHDPAGDRGELVVDVLDSLAIDPLPDLRDLLVASVG